jgi:hypothetical protein
LYDVFSAYEEWRGRLKETGELIAATARGNADENPPARAGPSPAWSE